jgi:hypothetical protein
MPNAQIFYEVFLKKNQHYKQRHGQRRKSLLTSRDRIEWVANIRYTEILCIAYI